jgi:hypothetical protein
VGVDAAGTLSCPDTSTKSFEDCFVAFVDILGFSSVVKQAATDGDKFETLRDALRNIDAQVQRLEGYRGLCASLDPAARFLWRPTPIEMTAFSDCYLISGKVSDGPWAVFAAVQALGANLLAHDMLTRGAVVCGAAYHQGRIAFGPAITEAVDIERNIAKYPRILVADGAREAIRWENENFWHGQLLRLDTDGCSFINVLTPPLSRWSPLSDDRRLAIGDMKPFLSRIREVLRGRLKTSRDDLRHLSKVRWLVHHFNLAAREHGLTINEEIENAQPTAGNPT